MTETETDIEARVNAAIVAGVLPLLYQSIDSLLVYMPPNACPKAVIFQARRLLPHTYANTLEKPKYEQGS